MRRKTIEEMKPGEIFYIVIDGEKLSCLRVEEKQVYGDNCVVIKTGKLYRFPTNVLYTMLVEF